MTPSWCTQRVRPADNAAHVSWARRACALCWNARCLPCRASDQRACCRWRARRRAARHRADVPAPAPRDAQVRLLARPAGPGGGLQGARQGAARGLVGGCRGPGGQLQGALQFPGTSTCEHARTCARISYESWAHRADRDGWQQGGCAGREGGGGALWADCCCQLLRCAGRLSVLGAVTTL